VPQAIVILGAGFAGIATARVLERTLRPDEAKITLVSRENYSLFTPMLPEVSSSGLEARHIVTPVRVQLRHTEFVLARVTAVDLDRHTIDVEHALVGTHQVIGYDQLAFALGSVTSTFDIPGVAERALPLKTLEDAERLRNHVIAMLEIAAVTNDPVLRARLLCFAFVGGGFTGVEAAGEMTDFFRSALRFYPTIAPSEVAIALIEGGKALLPDLDPAMGRYSARLLARRGIDVVLDDPVVAVDDAGLHLKSGRVFASETVVWSAGVRPPPLLAQLPLETRRGALVVNADMSVPNRAGLWAIGDCAVIPAPDGGRYPATAQHAIREGPALAQNITAAVRNQPTKPFRFRTIGMMASLGGRRGVIGLRGGIVLTGFLAWFLWRTYYLVRLPGADRRVRVAIDWTLDLIFPRDISELRVFSQRERLRAPATKPTAD
jgi:NADH:ubiquinone reductase (H+-translocating)